ncbi:AraC family transcriptional regulator [Nocardioides maradonensis]
MTTLERFLVLRTSNIDEFRANVARFLTPHRLAPLGPAGPVEADLAMVDLGPVSLVYGRNAGAELRVQLTEQVDYYDVNLALSGHNLLVTGDEQTRVDATTAGIISPRMMAEMQLSDGYGQLHVRIERHALERHLEELIDRPVAGPIRFAPAMDLATPAAESWSQAVRLLVRDLEDPAGLAGTGENNPWSRFLMSGLLLAQPHNYTDQLVDRQGVRRPLPLKRVIDLIESDPAGDHSVESLARIAGVSPRSLQRHFHEHVGATPRDYVRRVRLARAHDDLLAAGPGTTVADIALRWGFAHVPRFAAAYQDRYGEAPSQTLRNRTM